MAVSRARKTEQVEVLSKELKNISSLIVTTYSKLTVDKDFELRKTLRSSGAKYLGRQEHTGGTGGEGHQGRSGL